MGVVRWFTEKLKPFIIDNQSVNQPVYRLIPHTSAGQTYYSFQLMNDFEQVGTEHNEANMNNLFNFDNLMSVANAIYDPDTLENWIIGNTTETLKDKSTGILIASRTTITVADTSQIITEILYNETGIGIVQERKTTWTKIDNDWSADIV